MFAVGTENTSKLVERGNESSREGAYLWEQPKRWKIGCLDKERVEKSLEMLSHQQEALSFLVVNIIFLSVLLEGLIDNKICIVS